MQIFLAGIDTGRLVAALSRMLLHSLWQGMVLALLLYGLVLVSKKWKAAARYNAALLLFTGFLFAAACTFILAWSHYSLQNAETAFVPAFTQRVSQILAGNLPPLKNLLGNLNVFLQQHAQLIVLLWLLIFMARLVKMTGQILYNRRVKRKQVFAMDGQWRHLLDRLCAVMKISKTVGLLESGRMKMPVVIGHIKPLILLPLGLLLSVPAEQAEAILLHELAHIKRNDYLVNVVQHLVETVFFFNPAVWWASAWIREEREHCCDEMVIAHTKNKTGLVEALLLFKQQALYGNAFTMAFPGRKNQLLRRVSRILGYQINSSSLAEKLFFALASFLLLAAGTTAMMLLRQGSAKYSSIAEVKKTVRPLPQESAVVSANTDVNPVSMHLKAKIIAKKINASKKVAAEVREAALAEKAEQLLQAQEFLLDQQQAKIDQEQASKDQEQAMKDQVNAKLNHEKAELDQRQAKADQERAFKDQQRAWKDPVKARVDQQHASAVRKALLDKKEAERNDINHSIISARF